MGRTYARLLRPPTMVAISGSASAPEAFQLARLGVRSYLTKPFSIAEFRDSLRSAASPETREQILDRVSEFAAEYRLTERQVTLVRLALSELPRKRYADALGVSENTCKTMVRRLLRKVRADCLTDIPRAILVRGHDMAPSGATRDRADGHPATRVQVSRKSKIALLIQ